MFYVRSTESPVYVTGRGYRDPFLPVSDPRDTPLGFTHYFEALNRANHCYALVGDKFVVVCTKYCAQVITGEFTGCYLDIDHDFVPEIKDATFFDSERQLADILDYDFPAAQIVAITPWEFERCKNIRRWG